MTKKVVTVITAITGDRVVICKEEFNHARDQHFQILPNDMLLELIERILKDPTKIFEETKLHEHHIFYRLDNQKYLVVIVKKTDTGNYFSTMYSTGKTIRNKHNHLKEIKI